MRSIIINRLLAKHFDTDHRISPWHLTMKLTYISCTKLPNIWFSWEACGGSFWGYGLSMTNIFAFVSQPSFGFSNSALFAFVFWHSNVFLLYIYSSGCFLYFGFCNLYWFPLKCKLVPNLCLLVFPLHSFLVFVFRWVKVKPSPCWSMRWCLQSKKSFYP